MSTYRLAIRRDTASNWTSVDPVLGQGEPSLDITNNKIKVGDGVSVWSALPYLISYSDAEVDALLNTSTASSGDFLSWDGSDYVWTVPGAGGVGNFTDLTATSSFTSPGIDDNATTTQLTIEDASTVFNNDTKVSRAHRYGTAFAIENTSTGGKAWELRSTGVDNLLGTGDLQFNVDGSNSLTLKADQSAELSGDLTVTGNFESTGIDDNATSTAITITDGGTTLKDTFTVEDPTQPLFVFAETGVPSTPAYLAYDVADTKLAITSYGTTMNGVMTFETGGSVERMRIDANGNLGIGTTTPNAGGNYSNGWGLSLGLNRTFIGTTAGGDSVLGGASGSTHTALYSAGAEAMRVDASGNVGIGTDIPDGKLSVFSGSAGNVTADADADELVLENSGNVGLSLLTTSSGESSIYFGNPGANGQKDFSLKYYHESHPDTAKRRSFTFNSPTKQLMCVNNSGNVGIGDSSPRSFGTGIPTLSFKGTSAGSPSRAGAISFESYSGTQGLATIYSDAGNIDFYTGPSTADSFRMRLDSSGNLGLGTTTDAWRTTDTALQIGNRASLTGLSNDMHLTTNAYFNAGANWIAKDTAESANYYQSGGTHVWRTAVSTTAGAVVPWSESMRIDTSGNLRVAKSNLGISTVGHSLESNGVASFSTNSALTPLNLQRVGAGIVAQFWQGTSAQGSITSNTGGAPTFASASDERLKDNIVDHESELANVMSLRPTRWDWKDEASGSGEGFIAQELEDTAWSDLVSEGEDGFKMVSGLGAVETRLIKAMQEQQAMIEALKAEVEALKNA